MGFNEGGAYSSRRLGPPIRVHEAYGQTSHEIRAGGEDVYGGHYTLAGPTDAPSKQDYSIRTAS